MLKLHVSDSITLGDAVGAGLVGDSVGDLLLAAPEKAEEVRLQVESFNQEMIAQLAKQPEQLYALAPRKSEELIAAVLTDRGCDVHLTPATHDGGRDMLAVLRIAGIGEILIDVECKRYNPKQKIGVDILERFLFTIRERDRASIGIVATTSFFSPEAKKLANSYRHEVSLRDVHGVTEWLRKYGTWKQTEQTGIWTPRILQI